MIPDRRAKPQPSQGTGASVASWPGSSGSSSTSLTHIKYDNKNLALLQSTTGYFTHKRETWLITDVVPDNRTVLALTLLLGVDFHNLKGKTYNQGGVVAFSPVRAMQMENKQGLLSSYSAGRRDFPNIDLSYATLAGVDLSGANLAGAKLQYADLTKANLLGANLSKANLTGASLNGAVLTQANLSGAVLEKAVLVGARLYKADLREANLAFANLTSADLVGARLIGAKLDRAVLDNTDLTDAILTSASMKQSKIQGAKFSAGFNAVAQTDKVPLADRLKAYLALFALLAVLALILLYVVNNLIIDPFANRAATRSFADMAQVYQTICSQKQVPHSTPSGQSGHVAAVLAETGEFSGGSTIDWRDVPERAEGPSDVTYLACVSIRTSTVGSYGAGCPAKRHDTVVRIFHLPSGTDMGESIIKGKSPPGAISANNCVGNEGFTKKKNVRAFFEETFPIDSDKELSLNIRQLPILIWDDFQSGENEWEEHFEDSITMERSFTATGKYRWDVATGDTSTTVLGTPNKNTDKLRDFSASVTAGAGTNNQLASVKYGILFRADPKTEQGYAFLISERTYTYSVLEISGGDWVPLIDSVRSSTIKNVPNKLTVIAIGDHFTFMINDKTVGRISDDSIDEGYIAIRAEIPANTQAAFEFDNFEVRAP